MSTVDAPALAQRVAMFTASELLPTPPLPETTLIIFLGMLNIRVFHLKQFASSFVCGWVRQATGWRLGGNVAVVQKKGI
jgi:hypothetical protein